jgi:hypothetical protein
MSMSLSNIEAEARIPQPIFNQINDRFFFCLSIYRREKFLPSDLRQESQGLDPFPFCGIGRKAVATTLGLPSFRVLSLEVPELRSETLVIELS